MKLVEKDRKLTKTLIESHSVYIPNSPVRKFVIFFAIFFTIIIFLNI